MRIRVYRNLNNGKLSLLHKSLGRVLGYAESVLLTDVKFVILPGGKRRALETGQRNVHAFVEGDVLAAKEFIFKPGVPEEYHVPDWVDRNDFRIPLTYRPFSELGFVDVLGQEHLSSHMAEVHSTGEIFSMPGNDWRN